MRIINTAICSFGMSGRVFHAPFIHAHKGYLLYGVWERSAKSAAEIYPGIKSFDTLEEMLADDAIELVIVNTPNYTHFDYTKKALLANKHVLVEKAFTVTVREAEELITIAAAKNRKLSVFQNRRYDSDFKTVKKIFDQGILGKIVEAEFHFDRFNLKLSPKQHKETMNPGSGLLHDLGPHLIDQALFLFGMPESVFASIRTLRPYSVVNDYFDLLLFYPELTVRLKSGLIVKEPPVAYCLFGTNGAYLKPRADVQEDLLKEGLAPVTEDWGTEDPELAGVLNILKNGETQRSELISEKGNYMEFYTALFESILFNKNLPVSATDGLNVMRIIEAALLSHEEGRRIHI